MAEELVYKGIFWLPDNPEKTVAGVLTFTESEGTKLELVGYLGQSKDIRTSDWPIINGLTINNKKITLHQCTLVHRDFSEMEAMTIQSRYLLIGVCIDNIKELQFNEITATIKNLDNWIDANGLEATISYDGYSIKYKNPLPFHFSISNNFTLDIIPFSRHPFVFHGTMVGRKFLVDQSCRITIKFRDNLNRPLDELLNELTKFQMFMAFITQSITHPENVTLKSAKYNFKYGDMTLPIVIELYESQTINIDKRYIDSSNMIFSYKDIQSSARMIIENWFKSYDKIEIILGRFFNDLYNPYQFGSNHFLNIAQALESYHRIYGKNRILSEEDFKIKMESILAIIPKEYLKWVEEKLKYSNEPTLKERLEEILLKFSNKTLTDLIGDPIEFSKIVKNNRNYYTHFSENLKNKSFSGVDLYRLAGKMKIILICCMLDIIGLNKEEIDKLCSQKKYLFLGYLYSH